MNESALPLLFRKRAQHAGPKLVQSLQHSQRRFDGGLWIGDANPFFLLISLDDRKVFSKRKLHSGIAIQMTVRQMMHDLTHSPTSGPIGSVELLFRQAGNSPSE